MKILLFLALILMATGFSSCYYDNKTEITPISSVDTINVSYSKNIQPIFNGYCASSGCHGAIDPAGSVPVQLTDYAATMASNVTDTGSNYKTCKLYRSVAYLNPNQSRNMPAAAKMNDLNIKLIRIWLQKGAKNN
jgi:hypothetical protein